MKLTKKERVLLTDALSCYYAELGNQIRTCPDPYTTYNAAIIKKLRKKLRRIDKMIYRLEGER